MAEREVDLDEMMKGAVTDTEKEIYQYAVSGKDEPDDEEPDENPDRSPEQMGEGLEGQNESDEDAEDDADEKDAGDEPDKLAAKDADDKSDDQPRDDKGKFAEKADDKGDKPGQPPSRVLAEANERRRVAEERIATIEAERKAERDAAQNELRMLNAKLDGFIAASKPAKAEEPQQAEPVDLFENPQGFVTQLREGIKAELAREMGQTVQQVAAQQRVEMSLQFAASKHGEAFGKAFEEVSKLDPKNPDDQMTVRRIWSSPNPGERLVEWHRERELLREVGNDPTAYKQKVAQAERESLMKDPEFRKQLIEELKAEATGGKGGRPRAEFRPPKSLNGAAGGRSDVSDPALYDNSERAVFESAFTNDP